MALHDYQRQPYGRIEDEILIHLSYSLADAPQAHLRVH